jgi:hypothetical protein
VTAAKADEFRLCGRNHNLLFEIKKLFALAYVSVEIMQIKSVAIMPLQLEKTLYENYTNEIKN